MKKSIFTAVLTILLLTSCSNNEEEHIQRYSITIEANCNNRDIDTHEVSKEVYKKLSVSIKKIAHPCYYIKFNNLNGVEVKGYYLDSTPTITKQ